MSGLHVVNDKLYLNQYTVDRLREKCLDEGKTEEYFEQWLKEFVIIVEPIY